MTTLSEGVEGIQLEHAPPVTRDLEDQYAQYATDQPSDTLAFYELEGKILELWDRLNDLKLEIAVLEVQRTVDSEESRVPDEELSTELEKAEKECLNARAQYLLRQSVVGDTITAAPILNAVHAGINASATERTLKRLLNRRDALEIASTNLSSSLQDTLGKTTMMELENAKTRQGNRPLAAEVLALTEVIDGRNEKVKEQPELRGEIDEARGEADTAVKQWRIMKSVVAAVVAGSGVRWAEDEGLRDLVLDAEDEGEDD